MEKKIKISQKMQKRILVKMLKYIDSVCRKNKIYYSMYAGSLIGTIRHAGFIPWDDDIDIILDKKNYDKLIKSIKKDNNPNYILFVPLENNDYPLPFCKLVDKHTSLQHEQSIKDIEGYGLFLDIFCYNNVPNNILKRKKFYKKLVFLNKSIGKIKINYNNPKMSKKIIRCFRNAINTIFSFKLLLKKSIKHFNKYSNMNTNYVVSNYPIYGFNKEIQCKNDIMEYIDSKFENIDVMIFKNYNNILKNTYGDYMKLPPKEKRTTHNLDVYSNYSIEELTKYIES